MLPHNAMADTDFAPKLELVLKALAISRGRLASDLCIDKSLVSRWVSGTNAPSGHNLSNLTALIASRREGFTGLDWDRDLGGLAALFGGRADAPSEAAAMRSLPLKGLPIALKETAARGQAYDGFWIATRAAFSRTDVMVREQVMIRRRDGLLWMRCGGRGFEWDGWLLMLHDQLYGMASDSRFDSMVFYVLNGAAGDRAEVMDGLIVSCAMDRGGQTPTAAAVVFERCEELSGDDAADDARFETRKDQPFTIAREELDPALLAHLLRPLSPDAMKTSGDFLMRMPWDQSRSRGAREPVNGG